MPTSLMMNLSLLLTDEFPVLVLDQPRLLVGSHCVHNASVVCHLYLPVQQLGRLGDDTRSIGSLVSSIYVLMLFT